MTFTCCKISHFEHIYRQFMYCCEHFSPEGCFLIIPGNYKQVITKSMVSKNVCLFISDLLNPSPTIIALLSCGFRVAIALAMCVAYS